MIFKYEMQYIGHLVQNSQMHSISNVSFSNSNTFEKFLEIAQRLFLLHNLQCFMGLLNLFPFLLTFLCLLF